jgi:hypothetical protein
MLRDENISIRWAEKVKSTKFSFIVPQFRTMKRRFRHVVGIIRMQKKNCLLPKIGQHLWHINLFLDIFNRTNIFIPNMISWFVANSNFYPKFFIERKSICKGQKIVPINAIELKEKVRFSLKYIYMKNV